MDNSAATLADDSCSGAESVPPTEVCQNPRIEPCLETVFAGVIEFS